jgi:exonuclease SbcD
MKLLCTGDLHLGAGSDYGRAPGERLDEQAEVWQQIRRLAQQHDVQAILFAGDAFERRRPTPDELIAFHRELGYLDVVAIAGNHDVANADLASGIEVFEGGNFFSVYRQPGIHTDFGVEIACLPWTPVARLVAANGGGDRDELHARAAELLLDTARDLRSQCASGRPSILLLHWSVSGASLPTGLPTDTLREPVLPLLELEELGFDAIVMGHIHKAQVLRDRETGPCPIFYVGSPMPLNFGEASVDHGVWILDTDQRDVEFVPIESRPFVTLDLDGLSLSTSGVNGVYLCFDAEADGIEGAIVKVRYEATADEARRIDHAQIRQALLDAGAHRVYSIEPTIERPQRARVEGLDEGLSPVAALMAYVDANEIDQAQALPIFERTGRYLEAAGA